MAEKLRLAEDFALPLDAVTETIAVLGIRGSGKSTTAAVLVEELLAQGQQVVIIDPTDVWWGLKSSADGERPGHPVVVLGGQHADLPLGAGDGKAIADFVVEQHASIVCALRHFESQADMRRFVTEFCQRIYFRKGETARQTPLMLVIDEASLFVPQKVMGEEARMVSSIQRLVRQGRASGFGVTLIDQRASTVNKDVLTQLELLVAHRTSAPQDRKALEAWIDQHDAHGQRGEFLKHLASLPRGTAWFWSPGWLSVFRRVAVRQAKTFDSRRTPKPGERVAAPTRTAPVDLDALKAQLQSSIERARADDPKVLNARIRELEGQLRRSASAAPAPDPAAVERAVDQAVHVVDLRHQHQLREARAALEAGLGDAKSTVDALERALTHLDFNPSPSHGAVGDTSAAQRGTSTGLIDRSRALPTRTRPAPVTPLAGLTGPQQRILDTLASFEACGLDEAQKHNVAVFAGASPTSSAYANNLGALRTGGYIDYPSGGMVALTDTGRAIARAEPIGSIDELHEAWRRKLSGPQWRILEALIRRYPRTIERVALADQVEASVSSSAYANNLGALRSLGLIDYRPGKHVVATALLFPEALR